MFVNVRPSIIIFPELIRPFITNRRLTHRLEPAFSVLVSGFGQNTAIASIAARLCTANFDVNASPVPGQMHEAVADHSASDMPHSARVKAALE